MSENAAETEDNLRIVVAESIDELRGHVPAWDALAADCVEPNPFYESWMLIPAVQALGRDCDLLFVLVYQDRPGIDSRLCGFFPFQRSRSRFLGSAILTLWRHLHCFLCTPLLLEETAQKCLQALLRWAFQNSRGAPVMHWPLLNADGPFQQHFTDFARRENVFVLADECHTRAFWRPLMDAESYLHATISSRGRQDFRRQRKLLSQLGRLEFRALAPEDSGEPWLRQFLELEASGWKGQTKTALATRPIERDYFLEIAHAAHRRHKLEMLGLFLDDRPIALKCHFQTGGGSYFFKPAYDESLARYSPGGLLELESIEYFYRNPRMRWMDSCTDPDSFLLNRFWTERRCLQSVRFGTGSLVGELLVAIRPLLKVTRRRLAGPGPE